MSDTYCGKSCTECSYKEELKCPGCKMGPGRDMSNDCEIAFCCRMKGHKTCATCEIRSRCAKYVNKGNAPKERSEKNKAETERKESLSATAEFLASKVKILFFILILSSAFSALSSLILSDTDVVGSVISCTLSACYAAVLIVISRADKKFLISGLLVLAGSIINLIIAFSGNVSNGVTITIALVTLAVSLVAEYHEFMAHSDVLMAYENDLCDKWIKIWNWYVIALIGAFFGLLLGLGIIVLITAVVNLAVAVLKIVYLYQTAEVYRQYYWFNS